MKSCGKLEKEVSMMQKMAVWGLLFSIIAGSAGCYYVIPAEQAMPPAPAPYPVQAAPAAPSPPHGYVGPTDPQTTPPAVYVPAPPQAPPPPVLIPR
jgi:hypothetical protein